MDSPEARRQGVKALCQEIKEDIEADIINKIDTLMQLWLEIGVRGDAIQSRLMKTKSHLLLLLNDMYEGEVEMKNRLIQNCRTCANEAVILSRQLKVACDLPSEHLPILDRETKIREQLEALKQIKASRKKETRKLREEEAELCRSMATIPVVLSSGASTLSEEDLLELGHHVAMLRQEKDTRNSTFSRIRDEIISKLDLLDVSPEEGLEQQIVSDTQNFVLSKKNLEFMKKYLLRLKDIEDKRRQEHSTLMERVSLFWERLDIPHDEQQRFKQLHDGITLNTISALKQQLEQYERMKKERLKEFIHRTKDYLLTWYSKCFIPELKVRFEKDEDNEDFTDQRLEELEEELRRLKEFHNENAELMSKVERREALWTRFLEYEKRAADPSRLNNRGGVLLRELKEWNRLQAELPRLEEDIKTYISTHPGRKERMFNEWAKDFMEHVSAQHEARKQEKDRERQERENRRKNPGTPISRRKIMKHGLAGTPSCSASRFSRLGASTATTPTPSMTNRNVAAGRSHQAQLSGTPMRTPSTAKSIRRRSIKGAAQKSSTAAARRLMLSKSKASPKSGAAGATVGGPTSMDSFAHYLNRPDRQLLTSSVLGEMPATPRPEDENTAIDADITLCEE